MAQVMIELEDYQFKAVVKILVDAGKSIQEISEMAESIKNETPSFYSESNIQWIKKGVAQYNRGEGVVYDDVDQIIADRQ
jgi:hypothetical protein